ncbi:MAG: hypothetical protein ACFCGT_15810 [Sandaracinaceae bacterium]
MSVAPDLPALRPALLGLDRADGNAGPGRGLPRRGLLELAGGPAAARTTAACALLLEAQRDGDLCAWIQPEGGALYPPDLAATGIDLEALLIVHVPPSAGPGGLPRAAELTLRTGAFGVVVVDLSVAAPPRGEAWLGRLASLAREREARCVLLGPEEAPSSLGPLVPIRLRPLRRRVRPGRFAVTTDVLKDKGGHQPVLSVPPLRGPRGLP